MQNGGDMRLEKLVSAVFPLVEAQRALEASLDPSLYRVVVAMDETVEDEFAALADHAQQGGDCATGGTIVE